MSEIFIKKLANRVVHHPDFQTGITNLVGSVLQTVITEDFAGERFSFYAAKNPASKRRERNRGLREKFDGTNASQLSKESGLSVRMVMKIVKG